MRRAFARRFGPRPDAAESHVRFVRYEDLGPVGADPIDSQGAGAVEGVMPMLSPAPELRMATVTRHLANLDRRLRSRRFRQNAHASDLRERIREFGDIALSSNDGKDDKEVC
jgi:hypothetical protein